MKTKLFHCMIWFMLFVFLASTQPVQAYHSKSLLSLEGNTPAVAARQGNTPAVAGDEFWDDQFLLGTYLTNQPGSYGNFAIAVSGTNVYVGGDFDHAGNVHANHIARWDSVTHKWSALGVGVNNRVLAIAASGDDVYVGGNFTTAGGVSASNIAHWNEATQTWSVVGDALTHTSTSPEVDAIAIADNGDVYIGGDFEKAGDLTVNNIARWDGSSWHALSSGTGGTFHDVLAIALSGNDVYIGGQFETAGGSMRHNIAMWNGSTWSSLGSGTGGTYPDVLAIAINGSNIYIAGEFDEVTDSTNGTQAVGHVAMWNGSVWNTLGGGLGSPDAAALAFSPTQGLLVGGRFTTLADGATSANRLARWDGSAWDAVGGGVLMGSDGVDLNVYALAFMGDQLFVGGMMLNSNNGRTLNRIGYYDFSDHEWYALGNSVNSPVYALAMDGEDVYLGGSFTSAGGVKSVGVARWNQRTGEWSSLRGGVNGCTGLLLGGCRSAVYAILINGKDIYVGGNFTSAGGVAAFGIARWDTETNNWYALKDDATQENGISCSGLGCSAYVRALSMFGGHLYVGGNFDYAGGATQPAENVARWSGTNWKELSPGTNGTVYAIEALGTDEIYIGGNFSTPSPFISRCNLLDCSSLNADPVNGTVYAIKKVGYQLWVGGAFTNLGGPDGDFITTFSTGDWFDLGVGPLDDGVFAINSLKGYTFAGGDFTSAGLLGMNRIGSFYGSPGAWSGYGSGADATVYSIVPYTVATVNVTTFYIGGSFLSAGEKPSAYFARNGMQFYMYLPLTVR